MKDQYGHVALRRDGEIAIATIDRPPVNFVSVELIRSLADALEDVDRAGDVRAVVLQSEGKAFCAGADLASPTGVGGSGMESVGSLYVEALRLFRTQTPIVAAVQGAAVGAGLGLALMADFRVASPEARFASNFVKLGFHPGFGLTHTLPRAIGPQRAAVMCLTGRRIKGDEAYDWGMVDQLVEADRLRDAAVEFAREIAENAPLAVKATRATLRQGLADAVKAATDHELEEQTRLRATKDFAEGVRAVNERRAGRFVGA